MRLLFLLLMVFTFAAASAQDSTAAQGLKLSTFTAQFLVSTDLKAVYVNVAGAGIRYTRKFTTISLTIFPSLSFREDHPLPGDVKRPFVRPGFALGPLFQYKRVMMGFPAFYQDDAWHFTCGFGMKFGK